MREPHCGTLERFVPSLPVLDHEAGGKIDRLLVGVEVVASEFAADLQTRARQILLVPALGPLLRGLVGDAVQRLLVVARIGRMLVDQVEQIGDRRLRHLAIFHRPEIAGLGGAQARVVEAHAARVDETDEAFAEVARAQFAAVVLDAAVRAQPADQRHRLAAAWPARGLLRFGGDRRSRCGGRQPCFMWNRRIGFGRRRHRLRAPALGEPVLQIGDGDLGDCADAMDAGTVGEALGVEARRLADAVRAQDDLVFVERAGLGVVLVDDERLAGRPLVADQNVDMVLVGAFGPFDVAVVAGHFDRPRLAVGVDAAAGRALRVLDGDRQAVEIDVALAVVAGRLLALGRFLIDARARRLYVGRLLHLDRRLTSARRGEIAFSRASRASVFLRHGSFGGRLT